MSRTETNDRPDNLPAGRGHERFPWMWTPWFGYLVCLFLVILILLLEKLDLSVPHAPLFVGAPFALLSTLAAILWGLGPAIFTTVLGILAITLVIEPGFFSPNLSQDFIIIGPFVLLQIVAITVVICIERSRRRYQAANRELTAAHRELLQSHRQLERANELKNYIIMRASHELRTPLTTILGRIQLLAARLKKSGETSKTCIAVQKDIDVIEERTLHLRTLIESLFELSRIQAREIPLQHPPFDFGRLCGQVIADQSDISGRSITLQLPDPPIMLQTNEELLAQVLVNLVRNAINYSPEQTPIQAEVDANEQRVMFSIHNDGPVLSSEHLERLFEPFYRVEDDEYVFVPGWGLGLTICREIVEQYGGQIWADSAQDKGNTFFMTFPPEVYAPGITR